MIQEYNRLSQLRHHIVLEVEVLIYQYFYRDKPLQDVRVQIIAIQHFFYKTHCNLEMDNGLNIYFYYRFLYEVVNMFLQIYQEVNLENGHDFL